MLRTGHMASCRSAGASAVWGMDDRAVEKRGQKLTAAGGIDRKQAAMTCLAASSVWSSRRYVVLDRGAAFCASSRGDAVLLSDAGLGLDVRVLHLGGRSLGESLGRLRHCRDDRLVFVPEGSAAATPACGALIRPVWACGKMLRLRRQGQLAKKDERVSCGTT